MVVGQGYVGFAAELDIDIWASIETANTKPCSLVAADLVIMLANHSDTDLAMVAEHSKVIFDTRNAVQALKVIRL